MVILRTLEFQLRQWSIIRHEQRPPCPSVLPMGVEVQSLPPVLQCGHADDRDPPRFERTVHLRGHNDIPPRVQRVTVPSQPRVLHRGERHERIEWFEGAVQESLVELRVRQRGHVRMLRPYSAVLYRSDVTRAHAEEYRLDPWTLAPHDGDVLPPAVLGGVRSELRGALPPVITNELSVHALLFHPIDRVHFEYRRRRLSSREALLVIIRGERHVVPESQEFLPHRLRHLPGRRPPYRRSIEERMSEQIATLHVGHDAIVEVRRHGEILFGHALQGDASIRIVRAQLSAPGVDLVEEGGVIFLVGER
mmetsp:Transcript_3387/g.8623  ORF Transcript_3387/g.8623 Transcript_3387/m.8623 type:complete len:307 (+) Transcript_3387:280-1200(+)